MNEELGEKQDSGVEMSNTLIFDIEDCKYAAQASIELTKNEYMPKLREIYVGIVIFPLIGLLSFLCLSFVGSTGLEDNLVLGILMILGFCFFSYIVWSGSSDIRSQRRKRIESASNALKDLTTIESLVRGKNPYVLYLRDFAAGYGVHSTREVKNPSCVGGYTVVSDEGSLRMKAVTEYLESFMPIVMLHNSKDKTHKYRGHILYCSDECWFRNFKKLAEHASIVVLDYSGRFFDSPAIISEVEFLVRHKLPIVAVGTAEDIGNLNYLGLQSTMETTIKVVETAGYNDGFIVRGHYTQEVAIPNSLDLQLRSINRNPKNK